MNNLMSLDTFDALKKEYRTCKLCPKLCSERTQVVFGDGNPGSKILLIGEAPGKSEDKNGIPFCGMSGKILTQLLESQTPSFVGHLKIGTPQKMKSRIVEIAWID
jgi:uracil-DNA glycosylase